MFASRKIDTSSNISRTSVSLGRSYFSVLSSILTCIFSKPLCFVLCVLQVVSIIESRARAVDLMTHNYYELLYAFHINRHNYRKGKTDFQCYNDATSFLGVGKRLSIG